LGGDEECLSLAEPETLFTLAEIAITIAGFSAIVVGFKQRGSGEWQTEDADRFRGMLAHAMFAAFFCLFPSFISLFTADQSRIWSIASSVLGVQLFANCIIILRLPSGGWPARLSLLLSLGAFALQVLNVTAVHFSHEFRPYLGGVLLHVVQAGALFVSLVWIPSDIGND
jgi:hypothetical protein